MLYKTFAIDILTGTALDVWELTNKVMTRFSLQLEHTETSALRTSSEMKELASNDFFSNFENMESSSVSNTFLTLLERS